MAYAADAIHVGSYQRERQAPCAQAVSPEALRKLASRADLPVDEIIPIADVVRPATRSPRRSDGRHGTQKASAVSGGFRSSGGRIWTDMTTPYRFVEICHLP